MPSVFSYTENPSCPICHRPFSSTNADESYLFTSRVAVVKCDCGLWGLTPRVPESDILRIYQSNEYFNEGSVGYSDYGDQNESLRLTFKALLKNAERYRKGTGGLFEIGTGDGLLLSESIPFYEFRAGTDYSESAASNAREFADDMFVGGFDSVPTGYLKKHDIKTVVATNVIEHVYDPVTFMRNIYNEIPDDGMVILAAPDMGSRWRKLLGKRWPSFKFPEHVFYYDEHSLSELLRVSGFVRTERISCHHYFPLGLLLEKAGLSASFLPDRLAKKPVQLRGIMAAVIGFKQ